MSNISDIKKKRVEYKDRLAYVREFLQDFNGQVARSMNDIVAEEHRKAAESYVHPLIEFLYIALKAYQPEWTALEVRYPDYAMEIDRND